MKKGFAISGLVYSILILFLILIFGILGILGSRKLILDKMKNNLMGELNNELVNNIYVDDSGANYPKLVDKMIPVIYDESKGNWVYANIYEKWYDYDEKMWANAVVLKQGIVKAVGQEIKEEEIALMYVWIPRFKYVVFNANNEVVPEQQIDVIFESNINSTGTVKCVDAINQTDSAGNLISEICIDITNDTIVNNVSTYTHPAFTFGTEEITGFWVGKFENSTTDEGCLNNPTAENCNKSTHVIEIKANSDALRSINVSNMFTSIQNISVNYNFEDVDSHMIKNMEWGAVAYLTQSKYGRCSNGMCEEVTINNVLKNKVTYNTQTGCAGNNINDIVSDVCQNQYNTLKGVKASTTGNIYGVYDMSGGVREFAMGNMVDINGNFYSLNAGFINSIDEKYYDKYTYDINYTSFTRGKLGDATKETLSANQTQLQNWYNDKAHFVYNAFPWSDYSGALDQENVNVGIFYHTVATGAVGYTRGSRSILVKE